MKHLGFEITRYKGKERVSSLHECEDCKRQIYVNPPLSSLGQDSDNLFCYYCDPGEFELEFEEED